ncbi:MAG TPA: hypothetical protein VGD43_13250 [Micromonospora sp.]
MSIIEELGAQVRATAEELPVALVLQALDKFKAASERLRWVRQESSDPMGVPELAAATEHAETAGHALRVAQEQLATYLAAIGLARDGGPVPTGQRRRREPEAEPPAPPPAGPEAARSTPVYQWWSLRVAELTGHRTPADEPEKKKDDTEVKSADELLRRVADGVRAGDRQRLHAELRGVGADVGLGMAAIAPPMLRSLATELLGHPPRAQDLPRLRQELDDKVRDLLPGLPPAVLETLLTRVCRMPPPKEPPEQPHPADPAVASGVVTGLLLRRLGHDAGVAAPPPSAPPAPKPRETDA